MFLNNKKIPLIPPLFQGNDYVTDIKKKADLFNSFFAKQCFLVSNTSEIPLNLHFTTEMRLDTLYLSNYDVEKIIQDLDPNKAVMIRLVFAW